MEELVQHALAGGLVLKGAQVTEARAVVAVGQIPAGQVVMALPERLFISIKDAKEQHPGLVDGQYTAPNHSLLAVHLVSLNRAGHPYPKMLPRSVR